MNSKNTIEKNGTATSGADNPSPCRRPRPRAFLAAALFLGCILPRTLLSQTNAFTPKPIPNRFLIVVETSRAMDKREAAVSQVLNQLLLSGMNGQLRNGDSLGLWTFNDELHGGEFPLQEWTSQNKSNITANVLAFVQKQKFGKTGHLAKVLPELGRLARTSETITFVFLSSGNETITGTPFDAKLNEPFMKWKDQQAKAHQPFVAVLRASKGRLTDFTVTPAPWPVEMPPLPAPPPAAAPTQIVSTPKAPVRILPPLIVSGRKTNTVDASSLAAGAAAPLPAAHAVPISNALTNAAHPISPSTTYDTNGSSGVATAPAPRPAASAAPREVAFPSNSPAVAQSPSVAGRDPDALPVFARPLVPDGPETNSIAAAPASSAIVAIQTPRLNPVSFDKRLWLFGAAGFATVAGIILLVLSRSRHRTETSFITHSINRRSL